MKRIYRSEKDRMLCGVCGGIGEYFNVDPTLVRLGWIIITLVPPLGGILAYIIAAIIIPNESQVRRADL